MRSERASERASGSLTLYHHQNDPYNHGGIENAALGILNSRALYTPENTKCEAIQGFMLINLQDILRIFLS